jgi:paraquat-inducible protein A
VTKARLLILFSSAFLGIGLVAPSISIVPRAGEFTWLVELWDQDATDIVTYSIFGVIRDLYLMNDFFLALILGLFSVVFPVFKLSLYWLATVYSPNSNSLSSLLKWTARLSKFSMVEVLFLALMILTVKALPGGSEATIEWGAYLFAVSALGSMVIPLLFEKAKTNGSDEPF